MKLSLPSLNALRAFESAARFESFTKAAEELSVTHGAVSRQVAVLERYLNASLFNRSHRVVRLTALGLQLRDEITPSFLRLSEACERVRTESMNATRLRVSAPPAFSMRWLIPRLSGFQRRFPGIDVSLTNSVLEPCFERNEYDLAIRRLEHMPASGYSVPLFDEFSIPVCHVDLVAPGRIPVDFQKLMKEVCLVRVGAEPRGWEKWAKVWHVDLSPARFIDVELTYLAVQSALEGLGIALLPIALVSDDIARGLLVAPLGSMPLDQSTYYVVDARVPAKGSANARMIDWLEQEGADSMRQARLTLEK